MNGDVWSYIGGLREDLGRAEERIRELEKLVSVYGETLDDVRNRVYALEHGTPEARQLQYEADVAAADAREYDRHGSACTCSYCYYDPEEDESPLARRDAYIGTWSNQDVTKRGQA